MTVIKSCLDCDATYALDTGKFAAAVHDCDAGEWYTMPRDLAVAINAMTVEEAAAWAGVTVAEVRRLRGLQR